MTSNRFTTAAFMAAALLASTALAEKTLVNTNWRGRALHGYDTVAYFTDGKAVEGSSDYQSVYKGAKYLFANADHKKMFDADPAKYAPQFGGYCAWAVSNNDTADIDPEAFEVIDGKLYVQYDKDIRSKFDKDREANVKKAHDNWPGLVKSQGK